MSIRALRRRVAADTVVVADHVVRTRGAVAGLRGALRRVPPLAWVGGGLLAGLLAARLPIRAVAAVAATGAAWTLKLASTPFGAMALARARTARAARVPPAPAAPDGAGVDLGRRA